MSAAHDREALRQQMLLRALLGDARPGVLAGWTRDNSHAADRRFERGLAAYRANAGGLAERALAVAFPTLQQLVGEASFGALARHFWQSHPPAAGDVAQWGAGLPAFVADAPSLADEPYLADVARVDWAVHVADRAADAATDGTGTGFEGIELMGLLDPSQLRLQLIAGTAVFSSPYPVVAIWQAHRRADCAEVDRFAGVRASFAARVGENALVFRQGWASRVVAVSGAEARFTAALLAGEDLAIGLQRAGDDFDFEAWLIGALQQQRLDAVSRLPGVSTLPSA